MIKILDIPLGRGGSRDGCELAPAALRAAGLLEALRHRGHAPLDCGAVDAKAAISLTHSNSAVKALADVSAWTRAIAEAAFAASADGALPIFLGGDHSISAGTISGLARRAAVVNRPLFVLWVDAHPDFHTLSTTQSGNLHGVPLAYVSGVPGFSPWFPALLDAVEQRHICMLGTRSVDPAERMALDGSHVTLHDMRTAKSKGIIPLVDAFLDRVMAANGLLHVSFDVDFLDPTVAPAVGTAVPDGATLQEARLLMERLCDCGRVTSLDIVELNPMLDEGQATAAIIVDLVGRLVGSATQGIGVEDHAQDRKRA